MTSAVNKSPVTWCIKLNAEWVEADGRQLTDLGLPNSLYAHMRAAQVGQGNRDAFAVAPLVHASTREWIDKLTAQEPKLKISVAQVTLTTGGCKPERHTHDDDQVILTVDVVGETWTVLHLLSGEISWS